VRAVDHEGVIRVQRSNGVVTQACASDGLQQLRRLWESVTIYNGDSVIAPDMFVVAGRRILDLCGITALDQAIAISRGELEGLPPEAPVVLISMPGARGL
jgi:N-methylhydantoinase A